MFDILSFLSAALAEDIGTGDVTAEATIPEGRAAQFVMRAREELVVAGLSFLPALFGLLPHPTQVTLHAEEGQKMPAGAVLATLSGDARTLLSGERTALNLVQHLSGIATETRRYVEAVEGTGAQILDTRKTLPTLRFLQKYAVQCGGGVNHRMGLYDAMLIKDNHIAVAGGMAAAVAQARATAPQLPLQVECDTPEQLAEAIAAKVDLVLLDNMDLPSLTRCVAAAKAAHILTEASGNVNLKTVRAIAETGVERISIGRLTHSVRAVDIGLDEA